MAAETKKIEPESKLHNNIMELYRSCFKLSERYISGRYDAWRDADKADRCYIDANATNEKGKRKVPFETKVYVPVSRANKDVLIAYYMTVFTGKRPVIGIDGRAPEDVKPAKLNEIVLDYQLERQRIQLVFYAWLNNMLKYGMSNVKNIFSRTYTWTNERSRVLKYLPLPHFQMQEQEKRVLSYEGPALASIDPFRYFPDPRVPAARHQSGQFKIYEYSRSRYYLKKREQDGIYQNIDWLYDKYGQAMESGDQMADWDSRSARDETVTGSGAAVQVDSDFNLDKKNPHFKVHEFWVELIPKDYELSDAKYPQKWVFTVAGDRVIIRAERSVYGDRFPDEGMEYDFDGHSIFNPGFYENVQGLQDLLNWLYNSHMDNVRAHLNNASIINQLAVNIRDITKPNPARLITLKKDFARKAIERGLPIDSVFKQLQLFDVTGGHIKDAEGIIDLIQRQTHASDALQGVETEVKRTATEIARMSTSSMNLLGMNAQLLYAQGPVPLAEQCVINNQQFLSEARFYRVLGDYAKDIVQTDPRFPGAPAVFAGREDLQGYFDFPIKDGRLPVDPSQNAELWSEVLRMVSEIPALTVQYDTSKIFEELAGALGVKNIDDFKIKVQITPNETLENMSRIGDVMPMPNASAGAIASAPAAAGMAA